MKETDSNSPDLLGMEILRGSIKQLEVMKEKLDLNRDEKTILGCYIDNVLTAAELVNDLNDNPFVKKENKGGSKND